MQAFSGVVQDFRSGDIKHVHSVTLPLMGIRGYVYRHTQYVEGGTEFHIEQEKDFQCSYCGSRQVIGRGTVVRKFKAPPIGFKTVTVVLPVQRVECR